MQLFYCINHAIRVVANMRASRIRNPKDKLCDPSSDLSSL